MNLRKQRQLRGLFGSFRSGGGGGTTNQGTTTANPGAANNGTPGPTGTAPNNQQNLGTTAGATGATPPSGFDLFSKVMQKGLTQEAPKAKAGPFADFTEEAVTQMLAGKGISGRIPQERFAKIFGQNPEAITEFSSLMDDLFRETLRIGFMSSVRLADTGAQHYVNDFRDNHLPEFVRQNQVGSALEQAAPWMRDPAFKPMYDTMLKGLQAEYPNESVQDLT